MNLHLLQKIHKDVTRVKAKNTLKEDGINHLSKVGEDSNHSTEEMAALVNIALAYLSGEFEKVKVDATRTLAHATITGKKNVENGLRLYNAKAAEIAKLLPGDVFVKVGKYPWVAITFGVMAGFYLRGFLRPGRNCRK